MRSMLLQRICSSFAAGRSTAEKMLKRETPGDADEEEGSLELGEAAGIPLAPHRVLPVRRPAPQQVVRPVVLVPGFGRLPELVAELGGALEVLAAAMLVFEGLSAGR